jgi:ankyrin repeat protein
MSKQKIDVSTIILDDTESNPFEKVPSKIIPLIQMHLETEKFPNAKILTSDVLEKSNFPQPAFKSKQDLMILMGLALDKSERRLKAHLINAIFYDNISSLTNHEAGTAVFHKNYVTNEELESLPFSPIRIIIAHGKINWDGDHTITLLDDWRKARTSITLSLLKDKQDLIFILSCFSGAVHSDSELPKVLGSSLLVTCIDDRFTAIDTIDDEIVVYVNSLINLNYDPKLIVLSVISRFSTTIKVKMPNKESATFGNSLEKFNETLLKNFLLKAVDYLDLVVPCEFIDDLIEKNHARRQALHLDTGFMNWNRLSLLEQENHISQFKTTPVDLLNSMQDIDGNIIPSLILQNNEIASDIKTDLIKFWIEKGANLNPNGDSLAVDVLRFTSNIPLVKHLIDSGANPHAKSKHDGVSLLHSAIETLTQEECYDFFKYLLVYNIDLNAITKSRNTLLLYSLTYKKMEIATFLIENNIDLESANDFCATPIFIAARDNHIDIVKKLLEKQVDVNIPVNSGRTCLHVSTHNIEIMKLLIGAGADINAKDIHGNTVLHNAVDDDHMKALTYLIETNRLAVNIQNIKGETALHIASQKGHINALRTLLNYEALVNIKDKEGFTPLDYAKLYRWDEIYLILIEELSKYVPASEDLPSYKPFFRSNENREKSTLEDETLESWPIAKGEQNKEFPTQQKSFSFWDKSSSYIKSCADHLLATAINYADNVVNDCPSYFSKNIHKSSSSSARTTNFTFNQTLFRSTTNNHSLGGCPEVPCLRVGK